MIILSLNKSALVYLKKYQIYYLLGLLLMFGKEEFTILAIPKNQTPKKM